jgi:hypothetical protein
VGVEEALDLREPRDVGPDELCLPPLSRMDSATACPWSPRAAIVTLAPSAANSRAEASPMPDVPPVMIAALFSSFMWITPEIDDRRREYEHARAGCQP